MKDGTHDALMTNVYFDTVADEACPCELRKNGKELIVSYEDEEFGHVLYRGREKGEGHWVLRSSESGGSATLHRLPGSVFLEGYWEEDGLRGMWRIKVL